MPHTLAALRLRRQHAGSSKRLQDGAQDADTQPVARLRQFLNQDADQALDRLFVPYARFLMSHKLVLYGQGVAAIALTWFFVSKWLAVAMIALVVALFFVGLARALWSRRRTD
jgi:hypothetical protein